ncbi:hypothetical protein JAAARDRAFT_73365 [Jaapia argillacea MUCL 33604]|uniref:Fungal lipase-type domain-containing protein n=1 Tax=Jaapia argillacea MUCL 33604 TaxID=933084 RepID=A0A067PDG5_9AGAM|nr:hypothetical protein JAAARDRAFT_73365 [Jaapia argillacea MUCL 33604]
MSAVMFSLQFLLLTFAVSCILAAPAPLGGIKLPHTNLENTHALSVTIIQDKLVRPAEYTGIAYCPSALVQNWTCGIPCGRVKGIEILEVGGDDGSVPLYYIAHDPATHTIIVAHRGTDPNHILSIANDIQFGFEKLNSTWFPNADKRIEVHDGFQDAFRRTAGAVLSGVTAGIQSKGATQVLVTGHSLGAAIASMDAVMLRQHIDHSISMDTVVFGLPRVGNSHWADLLDTTLQPNFTHVTNQKDPVPNVPPHFMGYVHPSQEVHISAANQQGATTTVFCPGRENNRCSDGNRLFGLSVADHLGPYFQNITLASSTCV